MSKRRPVFYKTPQMAVTDFLLPVAVSATDVVDKFGDLAAHLGYWTTC